MPQPRRTSIMLPPLMAALMLVAFSLSGLLVGVLAHTLVASTSAAPRATATHYASPAASGKTPTPTRPAATGRFNLTLSVSAQQVHVGDTITVTAKATSASTDTPLENLTCTLSGPDAGASLLATWPAPQPTDDHGNATWHITIPQVDPGSYAIQVKASTTAPTYSANRIVMVFVKS